MAFNTITIATRSSPLALWQARAVASAIAQHHPDCAIRLLPLQTKGDQLLQSSLAAMGGKGLFITELEDKLRSGEADCAVHSAKDVPTAVQGDWEFLSVLPRGEVRDVLVLPHGVPAAPLLQLPAGAVIGTASVRRQSIIHALYPQYSTLLLRGNVATRLQKLDAADRYQAAILAAAGLQRLGYDNRIAQLLPLQIFLPPAGQGALLLEFSRSRPELHAFFAPLVDAATAQALSLERATAQELAGLGGLDCRTPLSLYATIEGGEKVLRAQIFSPNGKRITAIARGASAEQVQAQVMTQLTQQGIAEVLQQWQNA